MNLQVKLEKFLGTDRVKVDFEFGKYLTLHTHTKAQYYFEAGSKEDLIQAKKASLVFHIPIMILGGGSNLAIIKSLIEGLVVRNHYMEKKILKDDKKNVLLSVSSGYPVGRLVKETTEAGLEGFEYHLGLPGTVGGAIYMNSKWTRPYSYFGDYLDHAYLIDVGGREKKVERTYFQFAYDTSTLQRSNEILLEAVFRLPKKDKIKLIKCSREALAYRQKTQPIGQFSSGCFFRNISSKDQKKLGLPSASAGYLIDKAGLKGTTIGNYRISDKHANFIINKGDDGTADLKKLIKFVEEKIRSRYGLNLQKEVIVIS